MKILISTMALLFSASSLFGQEALERARDTVFLDGNIQYEGQWPEGNGIMYDGRRGITIGVFKNGKPDGDCVHCTSSGEVRFRGKYIGGKRNGAGVMVSSDGTIYVGEFVNDCRNGEHEVYRPDGMKFIATYEMAKVKSMECVGKYSRKQLKEITNGLKRIKLTDDQLATQSMIAKLSRSNVEHARFMGCDRSKFSEWVSNKLVYPSSASLERKQGVVLLRFTIGVDGVLKDVVVAKSSGSRDLDDEAVRVVSVSPRWMPATSDGKPVEISYTHPVIFRL